LLLEELEFDEDTTLPYEDPHC